MNEFHSHESGGEDKAPPRRARYFVTGLLTIIPLSVTVFILVYLVRFLAAIGQYPARVFAQSLDKIFGQSETLEKYVNSPWFINTLAVGMVVLLVYFLGMMTSNYIGRKVFNLFEWVLDKIPLVKAIYGAVKKLVDLVQHDTNGKQVRRVVLIEFPTPEMKTVGLVTRTFEDVDTGRKLAAVYVPTTPNPTSGYLEIVPVDRIVATDWTLDEAMSFIVSGGATGPAFINYDKSADSAGGSALNPVPVAGAPGIKGGGKAIVSS